MKRLALSFIVIPLLLAGTAARGEQPSPTYVSAASSQ